MSVAAIPARNRAPRSGNHASPAGREPRRRGWVTLFQIAALGAFLLALGGMLIAASSPDAALRSAPPTAVQQLAGPPPSPATAVNNQQIIVQVLDNETLWRTLRTRAANERLVRARNGISTTLVSFEFLYLPASDDLSDILTALAGFESLCTLEPCPTIHLIDLRSPHSAISSAPTPAWLRTPTAP